MEYANQTPRIEAAQVALGREPADMVITGGTLVNVYTGEYYPADIAVKGTRIAYVGDVSHTIGEHTKRIDAAGCYLCPGMIETHQHVGGSQLTMTEFAKAVLAHGTTGIITDFYEIGIARGKKAIRFCLDEMKKTPLKPIYQVASQIYVQNGPFGNSGQVSAEDLFELLSYPECIGISEWPVSMMTEKDEVVLKLLEETLRQGKRNLGHDSETPEKTLQAYCCLGHSSTHECVEISEAVDRARLGLAIMTRQGTAARDIDNMSRTLVERKLDSSSFMICTDEEEVAELYSLGHLDYKVRGMIERGVDPMTAVQMASIRAARYAGVDDDMGGIAPGRIADILIVTDLPRFAIDTVIANGEIAAVNYRYTGSMQAPVYPDFAYQTVQLPKKVMCAGDFAVDAPRKTGTAKVHVIGQRNGLLVTEARTAVLSVENGKVLADRGQDILKVAKVDRYQTSRKWGVGFVQGFGLKEGAMGNTWNGQKEDIFIVGACDQDMAVVANRLQELGGGFVAACHGEVVAEVALPLFGLLSEKTFEELVAEVLGFNKVIRDMGCTFDGPMTQLALMGVPVEIGTLKMSEFGLVDVWEGKLIDVVIE